MAPGDVSFIASRTLINNGWLRFSTSQAKMIDSVAAYAAEFAQWAIDWLSRLENSTLAAHEPIAVLF